MSPYYARIYRERPKPTVFFLSNVFASTPILSTGSMLQYLSHLNKQQILGIGIAVVIVVVTLAIFYFANKWEEADRGELTDYSSLMDNHETSDVMIGSTDKYEWSQGEIEMEVFVNLSKYANGKQKLRAKDLKVEIRERSLKVSIGNEVIIDGALHGRVLVDDSTWLIDEIRSSLARPLTTSSSSSSPTAIGEAAAYNNPQVETDQVLWITLFKAQPPSNANEERYWPALLVGEKEVQRPSRMSSDSLPPIHHLDAGGDRAAIQQAVRQALR